MYQRQRKQRSTLTMPTMLPVTSPSSSSLISWCLQFPSRVLTTRQSRLYFSVLLISRWVRQSTIMAAHWNRQKNWYSRKTFRKMNQPRSIQLDEEISSSTMAANWKKKLEEKLKMSRLLSLRCVRRIFQSWCRRKYQNTSMKNQKTSFFLLTQAMLWKWRSQTHRPHFLQWSFKWCQGARHQGQISSMVGNSGAFSKARILISLRESQVVLPHPIASMITWRANSPPIALVMTGWQASQKDSSGSSPPGSSPSGCQIQRQITASCKNSNRIGLAICCSYSFNFLTFLMSLMIPLLSVFLLIQLRYPSESLFMISLKYSAASQLQLAAALSMGVKYSLSLTETISQPILQRTFNSQVRLQVAQWWGAYKSKQLQCRQSRKQLFLPYFIAYRIGLFPKLSRMFPIPFYRHQLAAEVSSAAMAQWSAVRLSASFLKTISLPLRCCARGMFMVHSLFRRGFPSMRVSRSMRCSTARRGTMSLCLTSCSMGSMSCSPGYSSWGGLDCDAVSGSTSFWMSLSSSSQILSRWGQLQDCSLYMFQEQRRPSYSELILLDGDNYTMFHFFNGYLIRQVFFSKVELIQQEEKDQM